MKKRLFILVGVALLLIAVVVLSVKLSSPKGEEVEVQKVEKGDVAPTVTADGLITAKVTVNISSQVMGEIQQMPFKEGARVKKGDILVEINPDTYQRDVSSGLANMNAVEVASRQAMVTLAQRKLEWDRANDLFLKGVLSTQERDNSKLALDSATLSAEQALTQVAQAKAFYQKAQDNLNKTVMRSPIDGVVTAVNAKEGETAIMGTMNFAGTVILTVSDLSEIITEVQVDEVDLPRLRLEQPALVTVDALNQKQYEGTVIEIGASAHASQTGVQSNIRQFTVKVAITKPDIELKPGITARVRLIADRRKSVLRVSLGAVRTEEKEGQQIFSVFTVEKNKVLMKVIRTGLSDDLYTEVTSGLKEGDQVVTGPYRLLRTMREGDRVRPKVVTMEELKRAKQEKKENGD